MTEPMRPQLVPLATMAVAYGPGARIAGSCVVVSVNSMADKDAAGYCSAGAARDPPATF